MKNRSCLMLLLLIVFSSFCWFLLSGESFAAAAHSSQEKSSLCLTQIEDLIKGRTPDAAIAGEIKSRGIGFKVDQQTLALLRKLGAGNQTIQALLVRMGEELPSTLSCDKIVILVADFKSLNEQNYGVTEVLLQQLRDATKDYTDVEVKALGSTITLQQGSAEAVVRGKEQRATVVLWGWYTMTKEKLLVDVHCQFLQKPKNLVLLKEGQTLLLPSSQAESFEFQMRLAGEMTYLTLLTVGLARLEAEDYDGAIARFTAALNQPTVPETIVNPADIYYFRGVASFMKQYLIGKTETNAGTLDFDQAIKIHPHRVKAQLFRGIVLVLNEQYDKAILDFNDVIEREPENGLALLLRASCYRQKGEERLASADLIRAMRILSQTETDPTADQFLRAYGYFLSQDFDKAINEVDQVLKVESGNPYLLMFRAVINVAKQNYDAALIDINAAIRLSPYLPFSYLVRGAVYAEKGDRDKAIADYTHALELNPASADLYVWRAELNTSRGALDDALTDYNNAIRLNPAYVEAYSARARLLEKRGDFDHANADLNAVVKLQPDNIDAYYDRARFYEGRKDYARAIADYDEMISRRPAEADYFRARGYLYEQKGDIDRAIKDYDKAIELNPRDASNYTFRGDAHAKKNDVDRALSDYTKAIEAEPGSELTRFRRAAASMRYLEQGVKSEREGNLAEALRDYDIAIKFNPEDALAYAFRGSVHQELGRVKLAFQDYDKAIQLDPKNPSLFTYRASGHQKNKEFTLAIKDYDSAIQLKPNDADLYLERAEAQDRAGMIDQAVVDYEQALKLRPNFRLASNSREDSGLKYLINGLEYKMKGDLDQAIIEYDKSIKLRPNSPEGYLYRGEIFALKNDNVRAIEDLRKVIQIATDVVLRKKAEDLLRGVESKTQQPGTSPTPKLFRTMLRLKVCANFDIKTWRGEFSDPVVTDPIDGFFFILDSPSGILSVSWDACFCHSLSPVGFS